MALNRSFTVYTRKNLSTYCIYSEDGLRNPKHEKYCRIY